MRRSWLVLIVLLIGCGGNGVKVPTPAQQGGSGSPVISSPVRPTGAASSQGNLSQFLHITAVGFSISPSSDGQTVNYGFTIENPDAGLAAQDCRFTVSVLDGNNIVLGTVNALSFDVILPKQRVGAGGGVTVPKTATGIHIDVQIAPRSVAPPNGVVPLPVENPAYITGPYGGKITGLIGNPGDRDLRNVTVWAVAFDVAGKPIGGGRETISTLPAHGKSPVSINNVFAEGEPKSVEIYATPSHL